MVGERLCSDICVVVMYLVFGAILKKVKLFVSRCVNCSVHFYYMVIIFYHSCQRGPKKMRDVLLISLAFT